MVRSAPLTVLGLLLALSSPSYAQSTARISVDAAGAESEGGSARQSFSANGRFIAFSSYASDLVPGDTNGEYDVFVHDRLTGKLTRVSVDSQGVEGNDYSFRPSISGDGRFVAFESGATNFVPGDINNASDIFLHDRLLHTTTLLSKSTHGVRGQTHSTFPQISADGSAVVFLSDSPNLVLSDWNYEGDVFVHDLNTGHTTRVSVDSNGLEGDRGSGWYQPSISGNGRYIAFNSWANNLVAGDTNSTKDVFVHDRMQRITTRVSVNSLGVEADGFSSNVTISEDGRFVGMESRATNLVSNDTNDTDDVFVHDRITGITIRASVDSLGLEANGNSEGPKISADGTWIVFTSDASNLVPSDTNDAEDVFLHNIQTGITTRVSLSSLGEEPIHSSNYPSISPDGRLIGFNNRGRGLVPNDRNRQTDIFIHDQFGPTLTKQGLCPGGMTLLASGGTPGQAVAMLFGPAGSFVQSTGPCQGVELAIGQPQLGGIATTNSVGQAPFPFVAPAGACGLRVQAVNLATCTPTNVMEL